MPCVTSVYFGVIINSARSKFFKPSRGLVQGCPLSPFMFHLMEDGQSHLISEVVHIHNYQGVKVGWLIRLTHSLFIDGILIFFLCSEMDARYLKYCLSLLCRVKAMVINL
jgi:hypothetical protein